MSYRFSRLLTASTRSAHWLRRGLLLALALCAWVALTAHDAHAQIDWTQCLNDNAPGIDKNDNSPDPCDWSDGAVNLVNSVYYEGDGVPQRLLMVLPVAGAYTLTLNYDFTRADIYAYDFLASPFESQPPALLNECGNISNQIGVAACNTAFAAATPITIPDDPYPEVNAQEQSVDVVQPRVMLIGSTAAFSGAPKILDITHSLPNGTCLATNTCGTSMAFVRVQFTTTVPNQGVGFWFSAHIAEGAGGWGDGFGGASISGAPFHIALVSLNNTSLGNRENQISAAAVLQSGDIEIIKTTIGGNGTFDFVTGDQQIFSITTISNTGSYTLTNLEPGTYSVTETVPSGWRLIDFECSDGSPWDAIEFDGEEVLFCRFINEQNATLVVDKVTTPSGHPQNFDFTLGGDATATFALSDTTSPVVFSDLISGTYSLTETIPPGWELEDATCSDGSPIDGISIVAGEVVTCTFSNAGFGSLTVIKNTTGGDDSFGFELLGTPGQSFTLTTVAGTAQVTFDSLPAGPYGVIEDVIPEGWQPGPTTCESNIPNGTVFFGEFFLDVGEVITCTFTNEALGQIIIDKATLPAGSTQTFTFTYEVPDIQREVSAAALVTVNLTDTQSPHVSEYLVPGIYSVAELVPPGWLLTNVVCSDGSTANAIDLSAGEVVTCTFTNTQLGRIVVDKNTLPAGSTQPFTFNLSSTPLELNLDFTLTHAQTPFDSGELLPGTYRLVETQAPGWLLTNATCSDQSLPGAITLDPGEIVTCTFTNTQLARLVVDKNTLPAGSSQPFSFTLSSPDGPGNVNFSLTHAAAPFGSNLVPGLDYALSETLPAGWVQTGATCTGGNSLAAIAPDPGEVITCTITNTLLGSITIVKNTIDGNGPFNFTGDLGSFSLTTTGTPAGGTAQRTFAGLTPGAYGVIEVVPALWSLESVLCSDGSPATAIALAPGESVTCTFINQFNIPTSDGDTPEPGAIRSVWLPVISQ